MAENGVIGRDGQVPWHLPDDLRHFKAVTMGGPVVMGRRTFESIDSRPLPGRRTIVLSRDPAYAPSGVEVAQDLDDALSLAADADEVFIAGGTEVYRSALPRADRLYLTVVHATVEGDTRFPPFDAADWILTEEGRHEADDRHRFAFTIRRYDRRR